MLDRLTKSKGGRMGIHFEAGLKRPRDATESAKLVSEAAAAVRCHVHILPTRKKKCTYPPNMDSVQE